MEKQAYTSPEIKLLEINAADVITSSELEEGVETTPSGSGGVWEELP